MHFRFLQLEVSALMETSSSLVDTKCLNFVFQYQLSAGLYNHTMNTLQDLKGSDCNRSWSEKKEAGVVHFAESRFQRKCIMKQHFMNMYYYVCKCEFTVDN